MGRRVDKRFSSDLARQVPFTGASRPLQSCRAHPAPGPITGLTDRQGKGWVVVDTEPGDKRRHYTGTMELLYRVRQTTRSSWLVVVIFLQTDRFTFRPALIVAVMRPGVKGTKGNRTGLSYPSKRA